MITHVAIDPGANGGIAWRSQIGNSQPMTEVSKMPDTPMDIWIALNRIISNEVSPFNKPTIHIENVGGYMPGNSGPASVKFARHIGNLEMAVIAAGLPLERITPRKWMTAFLGTVPKEKRDRKRAIKVRAQERYPGIKVTLWNADALGMLWVVTHNDGYVKGV